MNLYNKYRPQHLDQIVGNVDVVDYLKGVLAEDTEQESFPHVTLFHGPTGCGKTTLARIVARGLGCDMEVDFLEINSSDYRGIDTVRQLIQSSRYKSMSGGVRVWLIDEVHGMTRDAQNALLKLLEDTPDQAYFILCTTDASKLLPTVKGRCMQLQVNPLNDIQMRQLLRSIVKSEGDKLTVTVYDQIVQDSFGLPRNAIQILERVLKVDSDRRLEMAKQSASQYSESIELCRALMSNSGWKQIRVILNGLKDQDPESIRRHVLGYAQSVLLNKDDQRAAHVIEELWEPLYDVGFPGLVYACYSVVKS